MGSVDDFQKNLSRRPIVEIMAGSSQDSIPFDGKFLTNNSEDENHPSTIVHSSGRVLAVVKKEPFDAVSGEAIPEKDKSKALAKGISTAMNTTIFGLAVAIPTLVFYTMLHSQTSRIIDEMDEHLVKLINLITGSR